MNVDSCEWHTTLFFGGFLHIVAQKVSRSFSLSWTDQYGKNWLTNGEDHSWIEFVFLASLAFHLPAWTSKSFFIVIILLNLLLFVVNVVLHFTCEYKPLLLSLLSWPERCKEGMFIETSDRSAVADSEVDLQWMLLLSFSFDFNLIFRGVTWKHHPNQPICHCCCRNLDMKKTFLCSHRRNRISLWFAASRLREWGGRQTKRHLGKWKRH